MCKRVVAGLVAAAIFIALFAFAVAGGALGRLTLLAVLCLLTIIAHREMLQALRHGGLNPKGWPGYFFSVLAGIVTGFPLYMDAWVQLAPEGQVRTYAVIGESSSAIEILWTIMVLLIMALLCQRVISRSMSTMDALASLISFIYPLPLFVFVGQIVSVPDPAFLTILLCGVAIACVDDACALFAGKFFGKHKLSPQISPKKTVEGSIGGILGGIVCSLVLWGIQGLWGAEYSLWAYLPLGLLCSVAGQIGDLAASAIKRQCGIKDYGKLLPGHGGVLDRLDSILFALPIAIIYFRFFVLS